MPAATKNNTNMDTATTTTAGAAAGATPVVLPAQSKNPRDAARNRPAQQQAAGAVQQVYAPGYRALLEVPAAAVRHLPDPGLNVTRLVLCSNYDAAAADPEGSCPMGSRCKFVHADTRGAREKGGVHVNYAWRSAEEVTYERFRAGKVFQVAPPNGKTATDVMDSQMALKTKALGAKRRPLSHCAHYYFNRACNLGADCQFIHAVFIDPEARKYQRAPMPSQLGREHQRAKAAAAAAVPEGAAPTVTATAATTTTVTVTTATGTTNTKVATAVAPAADHRHQPQQHVRRRGSDSVDASSAEASMAQLFPTSPASSEGAPSSGSRTPLLGHSPALEGSVVSAASSASTGAVRRYRHDPYRVVAAAPCV